MNALFTPTLTTNYLLRIPTTSPGRMHACTRLIGSFQLEPAAKTPNCLYPTRFGIPHFPLQPKPKPKLKLKLKLLPTSYAPSVEQ